MGVIIKIRYPTLINYIMFIISKVKRLMKVFNFCQEEDSCFAKYNSYRLVLTNEFIILVVLMYILKFMNKTYM